jgi:hypothetical protein
MQASPAPKGETGARFRRDVRDATRRRFDACVAEHRDNVMCPLLCHHSLASLVIGDCFGQCPLGCGAIDRGCHGPVDPCGLLGMCSDYSRDRYGRHSRSAVESDPPTNARWLRSTATDDWSRSMAGPGVSLKPWKWPHASAARCMPPASAAVRRVRGMRDKIATSAASKSASAAVTAAVLRPRRSIDQNISTSSGSRPILARPRDRAIGSRGATGRVCGLGCQRRIRPS